MEEENDVLDWGGEDDEGKNQDTGENGAIDARRTDGDNDDEDAVSLGDEEEYSTYQQEDQYSSAVEAEGSQANVAPPSTEVDDTPSTSGGLQREDSSTSQLPSSNAGTPRRNSSTSRRSPPRSLAPRITHALPPKPVVTNVPFLHPSHPSIVEATAMSVATRTTGRSESNKSKVNGAVATTVSTAGNGKVITPVDLEPLPRGWEAREARSGSGGTYYYNSITQESTWTRPVSSPSSSTSRDDSSRRRRGGHSSLRAVSLSPPQSDHSCSQTQEHSRHSRRQRLLDHEHMVDVQPVVPQNLNGMSYDDRHYRPGAGADGTSGPGATNDRHHRNRVEADPRFNPRPDQAFTPSPGASPRAHERSLSPLPPHPVVSSRGRDTRSSRAPRPSRSGHHGNTDVDSSTLRDRNSYSARDSWDQDNSYQEPRRQSRQHYEPPYEASMAESRSQMPSRNGSIRSRREPEPPMREESRIENMSDSRTRSPPPNKRENRNSNNDEMRERDHDRRPVPPLRGQEGQQMTSESITSPQFSTRPPPHQRRDRMTRFGQPTSTVLPTGSLSGRERQNYHRPPLEEDDPLVPDDIRSPPPNEREVQQRVFNDFYPSKNVSDSGPSSLPPRRLKQSGYDDVRNTNSAQFQAPDHGRHSPSEQNSRRVRPPLPPQSAEFAVGVASRPRDVRDRQSRQSQDRPLHPNDHEELRDIQRTQGNPPIGPRSGAYGRFRDNEFYLEDTAESPMLRQRNTEIGRMPPDIQDVLMDDMEESMRRRRLLDRTENEDLPNDTRRRGSADMASMHVRRGELEAAPSNGYPSDSMYTPRGPRAMSSTANTSSVNPNGLPSPVAQTGFNLNPSLRRSPPPHMRETSGARGSGYSGGYGPQSTNGPGHTLPPGNGRGGRRDRGRANDFSRPPPAATSGTNNVPIGNNRKSLGHGGGSSGPPGLRMSGGSQQSGMGGNSGPNRNQGFRDPIPANSSQRDLDLPAFERDRSLSVDVAVTRERDHYSTSPNDTRHGPMSVDPARLAARTWTPRGEAPPDVFIGAANDERRPTPPRESPHVSPIMETRRPSRNSDSRDRSGRHMDGRHMEPPRLTRQLDEPHRSGALEGRLSDRFESQAPGQQHPLPPTPKLQKPILPTNIQAPELYSQDYEPKQAARRRNDKYFADSVAFRQENPHDTLPFGIRNFPGDAVVTARFDVDMDPPPQSADFTGRKRRPDNRPELPRRPGSLLERLEMPVNGNDDSQEEPSFSRSLSDRVQVPVKRDRDEMDGDRFGPDESFDGDDVDPAAKRVRRKNTKMRRTKRL